MHACTCRCHSHFWKAALCRIAPSHFHQPLTPFLYLPRIPCRSIELFNGVRQFNIQGLYETVTSSKVPWSLTLSRIGHMLIDCSNSSYKRIRGHGQLLHNDSTELLLLASILYPLYKQCPSPVWNVVGLPLIFVLLKWLVHCIADRWYLGEWAEIDQGPKYSDHRLELDDRFY